MHLPVRGERFCPRKLAVGFKLTVSTGWPLNTRKRDIEQSKFAGQENDLYKELQFTRSIQSAEYEAEFKATRSCSPSVTASCQCDQRIATLRHLAGPATYDYDTSETSPSNQMLMHFRTAWYI
jgi:hypothetical protein